MNPSALILIAEGSEEIEAITPADVLVRAGVDVLVTGVGTLTPAGSRALPLRASSLASDVSSRLFDAVVLPGGTAGAANLAASPDVRSIVLRHAEAGRIIAAICAAPARVLAPLGLLDGRRATGYPGTEHDFGPRAHPSTDRVVVDGTLITGRAAGAAMEWSLAIARALAGEAAADQVARSMLVED